MAVDPDTPFQFLTFEEERVESQAAGSFQKIYEQAPNTFEDFQVFVASDPSHLDLVPDSELIKNRDIAPERVVSKATQPDENVEPLSADPASAVSPAPSFSHLLTTDDSETSGERSGNSKKPGRKRRLYRSPTPFDKSRKRHRGIQPKQVEFVDNVFNDENDENQPTFIDPSSDEQSGHHDELLDHQRSKNAGATKRLAFGQIGALEQMDDIEHGAGPAEAATEQLQFSR